MRGVRTAKMNGRFAPGSTRCREGARERNSMATVAKQVFYEGRVQGVGFRYSVKQVATGYEVVGWVRNLADGRVELRVSGEAGEVEAFLREIAESHLAAHIGRVEEHDLAGGLPDGRGFQILG